MKKLLFFFVIFLLAATYLFVKVPKFIDHEDYGKVINHTSTSSAGIQNCSINVAKLDTIADEITSEKFPNMTNCGHTGCFNITTCTAVVFIHTGFNQKVCVSNYSVYKAIINMRNWTVISLENSSGEEEKSIISKCGSYVGK
ncbi:hypothetical protein E3E35_01560 [Thermococcus sp. GR7]|uniref:hypothetical protein n=1 Tax=unclassified Thermococcus TaxID=2627626 RepID=UPI001430A367|nr:MULTISPECIES: hypothetical protein [unclassified Thermococcus]NJE46117.1 hypothetical protein [Thermococcus sp. GR7]NJE78247.1 hypothetical protein [Thermococcus sp. GR4]NJF22314.1 hypothetical protein [Thermococcus sp. GR5]